MARFAKSNGKSYPLSLTLPQRGREFSLSGFIEGYTMDVARLFLLIVFILSFIFPLSPAHGEHLSYVIGMQQRREQRRRARLVRRFPSFTTSSLSFSSFSSSPSSISSAVPRTDPSSDAGVSPAHRSSPSASEVGLVTSSFDPLPTTDIRADIPLLGSVTPILGSARIFPEHEPVDFRTILVDFVAAPSSIDSLLLYNGDRRLLGRATLDASVIGGKRFTLQLLGGTFVILKREERSVYVRALLKDRDVGGSSGDVFQIKEIRVEGDGMWSNEPYGKTLTETFPTFQAARARLVSVTNAEEPTGILVAGLRQRIGALRFLRERSDASAEFRVTGLTFQVSASSDVTLTNAVLRGRDAGDDHGCTVGSVSITCSAIPAGHGVVGDSGRVIELYADVAVAGTMASPFLQVTLNDPGTVDAAGHISWTDGTTTFTWVQFEQPVVRGIRLR